jgi:hypothetical protein
MTSPLVALRPRRPTRLIVTVVAVAATDGPPAYVCASPLCVFAVCVCVSDPHGSVEQYRARAVHCVGATAETSPASMERTDVVSQCRTSGSIYGTSVRGNDGASRNALS